MLHSLVDSANECPQNANSYFFYMVENNFSPGSVIRKKGIEIPFDNISIKKDGKAFLSCILLKLVIRKSRYAGMRIGFCRFRLCARLLFLFLEQVECLVDDRFFFFCFFTVFVISFYQSF